MREPKYPDIHVQLSGNDGNAFGILGNVLRGMKRGKVSLEDQEQFRQEATSGDYDNLLQTCMKWVEVS